MYFFCILKCIYLYTICICTWVTTTSHPLPSKILSKTDLMVQMAQNKIIRVICICYEIIFIFCKHVYGIRFLYLGHFHFHTLRNEKGLRCSSVQKTGSGVVPSVISLNLTLSLVSTQPNPTSTSFPLFLFSSFPPPPQLCSSTLSPSSYKSLTMSSSLSTSISSPDAPP